ncbi:putative Endonuclease/exonuclease/phosphatase superfamily [Helianthus annuus]|nr:putative Endonuclease/exonuclease/phosphatase superfamily [Helianthus annuus]
MINILNIYGPQGVNEKRILWDNIQQLVEVGSGFWVVAGHYNVVRSQEDRRNTVFDPSSSRDFNRFIEESGLHEFNLTGNRFTYFSGNKMSRIDHILVCWNLFNEWPSKEYRALPRLRSDHCPLILKTESRNFGPKPFRFFNSWLQRTDFEKVVTSAIEDFVGSGPPDLCLMRKFKFLRQRINRWKDNKYKMEQEEQLVLQADLTALEETLMERDLVEAEQWAWEEIKKRLYEIDEYKFKDLQHKARNNWAKYGDDNTSFFHGCINK